MKWKFLLQIFSVALIIALFTDCKGPGGQWGGGFEPVTEVDDDSDRPEWAQGNKDKNPHIKGNDDSGTMRGGEYGDLYVLRRDDWGVPVMTPRDVDGDGNMEYFVQPIDAAGNDITLDQYGELPENAPVIEVDFGRLNIVRSPTNVLTQALNEALKVLAAPGAVISLDFCGRLVSTYPDPITGETIVKTIDSPRENMAIYRTIMQNMNDSRLSFLGSLNSLKVAASCFAAGSDKTGTVDIDEVVYINGFMDCVGLDPIVHIEENNKEYFNFSNFNYNRDFYATRMIQFLVWDGEYYGVDENGDSSGPVFSVKEVFEGTNFDWQGIGSRPEFTNMYGSANNNVKGFATAVDDAVQVLDFVHGDSNVRFLPNYPEEGYKPPEL